MNAPIAANFASGQTSALLILSVSVSAELSSQLTPTVRYVHIFPETCWWMMHEQRQFQESWLDSRRKRRNGMRYNGQEVLRHHLHVLLVLSHVLVCSFGGVNIVAISRRHGSHGFNQRLNETTEVVVAMDLRKGRKEASACRVSAKQGGFVFYRTYSVNHSEAKQIIHRPVWATSRSIITFSKDINAGRVSNRFSRTEIMMSTSPGGQVSQIATASIIYDV